MRKNITIDTDAYKIPHWLQYPDNLTKLYSYGESRVGSRYPFVSFFGLSAIIKEHFLQKVTDEMIEEGEEESYLTFGTKEYFNTEVWKKVKDLGYLPIEIKAVPEGTKTGIDNVLFTIQSTEKWFAKTINSLESTLMHIWYPTTVATRAMYIKENIKPFFDKSSDISNLVLPVAVNDFGYRGGTCFDASAIGGAAHLVHFVGSDNMPANRLIKDYYGFKGQLKSVWATEHSVATSFGLEENNEIEYLKHQLIKAPDDKIVSIVIDSKDSDNFIKNVVGNEEIIHLIKQKSGRVVFRPDSGNPLVNICKYSDMLGSIFGFKMNQKGYKIIGENVGLIQGDGMDENSIPALYEEYIKTGWAADNVITGSGGGLLQVDINRDIQRFAIKASYGEKDGVPFNIKKNPKTDQTKASKSGILKLHNKTTTFESSKMNSIQFNAYEDILETVFKNGELKETKFEDILKRAN